MCAAFGVVLSEAPNLLRKRPPLAGAGSSDALSGPLFFLFLILFMVAICAMEAAMGDFSVAFFRLFLWVAFIFLYCAVSCFLSSAAFFVSPSLVAF